MKTIYVGAILCMFSIIPSFAQKDFRIKGHVYDYRSKKPIAEVVVRTDKKEYTISNPEGYFEFHTRFLPGNIQLKFQLLGYHPQTKRIDLNRDLDLKIYLVSKPTELREVVVAQKSAELVAKSKSQVISVVSEDFMGKNRENSLMQTLEKVAGVSSMTIGSGQSKPTIRGLGFNRVAVVQNGVKHEAQQWGADHGLEIDQYGLGEIEIIKGPTSLLYGSDAIAGVLRIKPQQVPQENSFGGEVNLLGETNNDLFGVSAAMYKRNTKWYVDSRLTYRDYGDYKVPTDKIEYNSYIFNLHNRQLRNTAGREANASLRLGYIGKKYHTSFFVSNVNAKNGFFANAHGTEVRLSKIDYDADNRDIDLPFHKVNHFKFTNTTKAFFGAHRLRLDLGFQNNVREEHAEPAAHGYMPKPEGTKERRFVKNTFSFRLTDALNWRQHELQFGFDAEFQDNQIGGWGFLIPEYQRVTSGVFAANTYKIAPELQLQAGLRYDFGLVATEAYYDWFQTPVSNPNGTTSRVFLKRANDEQLFFHSASFSLGLNYQKELFTYKLHLGKSYRIPLANELSSDGVNYHMFRFEEGNSDLDAESSYQLDAEIGFRKNKVNAVLAPFVNWFPNFIYLNPTADYFETLQIYRYTQAALFRLGGELHLDYSPIDSLELRADIEYVYARQLDGPKKDFTIPFSPPLSALFAAQYNLPDFGGMQNPQLTAEWRVTAAQERIVPPEEITNGYQVFNVSWYTEANWWGSNNPARIRLKVNNIFDKKYFNHTSFYRLIDVPEAGRNFSLAITVPF